MSNLPPGVTGNEYAIAGPEFEAERDRECEQQAVDVRTISDYGVQKIKDVIDDLAKVRDGDDYQSLIRKIGWASMSLRFVESEIEDVTLDDCPFGGVVTVQGHHGVLTWVCPICRHEHEEEAE